MAKDRTRHARHARHTELDSRYEPLFDVFGRETGQAIIGFAEEQWQMAVSFADAVLDAVLDCAEMCRRLTDDSD